MTKARKGAALAVQEEQPQAEVVLTTYKGFDADWSCRGFKYEIGQTYEHQGSVEHCSSGFHACEHPLDVWRYYGVNGSKFALVEQSGTLSRESGGDSKIASQRITIKAELKIPALIKAAIEFTFGRSTPTSGDSANSATSGYSTQAEAAGANAVAACVGSGRARGGEGGAIVLVERGDDLCIAAIFASKVGENGIKPGVWYELRGGKPVGGCMSALTATQEAAHPATRRAEAIFGNAHTSAHAYIRRISHTPESQAAVEARLGFQVGVLQGVIRNLCDEIETLKTMVQQRDDCIADMRGD